MPALLSGKVRRHRLPEPRLPTVRCSASGCSWPLSRPPSWPPPFRQLRVFSGIEAGRTFCGSGIRALAFALWVRSCFLSLVFFFLIYKMGLTIRDSRSDQGVIMQKAFDRH